MLINIIPVRLAICTHTCERYRSIANRPRHSTPAAHLSAFVYFMIISFRCYRKINGAISRQCQRNIPMRIVPCQLRVFAATFSRDVAFYRDIPKICLCLRQFGASLPNWSRPVPLPISLRPAKTIKFSVRAIWPTDAIFGQCCCNSRLTLLCDAGFSLDFDLFVVCFAFGWLCVCACRRSDSPAHKSNKPREIATNCVRDTIFFGIVDAIKMVYSPPFAWHQRQIAPAVKTTDVCMCGISRANWPK